MNDTNKEHVLRARKTENAMRLLAAFFYEPDKSLLEEENIFKSLRECLDTVCPAAVTSVDSMEKEIQRYSDDDLKIEHARLFVGPYALVAAPYGSVYLDDGRRVMGDSTMEVIKWYEQEGLGSSEDCKELPDHISIELEFLSFLLFKEIEALENSDPNAAEEYANKQRSFTSELLSPWVPDFCRKIKEGTDNDYYGAVADCLAAVFNNYGSPD